MPMMYGYGMSWFSGIFMMLIPLVILGLVVYWASRSGVRNTFGGNSSSALDILKERYARSEITTEEYRQIKDELSKK